MVWQDIVIFIGQWVFVIAIIPTILGKEKPALSTSIVTGTVLVIFALTYLTLKLWLSTISASMISAAWFLLALQKYNQNRRKKIEKNSTIRFRHRR